MSYATVAEIASEFKSITFDSNSALTDTEVGAILDQTDALINAHLSVRYITPITGAESLLILKKIEIDFASYRVAKILNLKKEIPLPDTTVIQDLNNGAAFKTSSKMLERIYNGDIPLPDAVPNSSATGFSDYNSANSVEPIFKRDVKQW